MTEGLRAISNRILRDDAPARRMRTRLALARLSAWAGGRNLRLLDAGCDVGLLSLALARRFPGWEIVAADINDEMLELGRAWAAEEGLRVDYRHMDLTREVPEASFDATVALECLTTIPDLDAALAQLARSLVPGGLFIAHVPDRDWRPVLPGSPTEWETAVRHGFDAAGLAAQLDAHGLRVTWTQPTMRTPLHVAQELRDRVQHKPARVRLALHPLLMVTAALELRGLAFGPARGLYVEAVRR